MSTAPSPVTTPRWPWTVLLGLYLLLALVFSVIQPLGRTPDEIAHVTYVSYLAQNLRLPIWSPQGGGEAGYEAQHPPLYYGLVAVVYRLTSALPEEWRWHLMRWFTILVIGVPMFLICRRFFTELWGEGTCYPLIATATVMLMPMLLLYTAYINPDAMAMLWATLALWLAWRRRAGIGEKGLRGAALLGLVAGLAALSKVSGAPALVLALLACVRTAGEDGGERTRESGAQERDADHIRGGGEVRIGKYRLAWTEAAATLAVFLLTCGWWYARNAYLYGTPLIHTEGMMGSALQAAARSGFGGWAWLTLKETYLSSWVQRGWFPTGFWTVLLYGIIILVSLGAAAGLVKGKAAPRPDDSEMEGPSFSRPTPAARERLALNYSGLLLALVFLGHQWAYWTVDLEFNAGGRYVLVAMAGLSLLVVSGLRKLLGGLAGPVLWGWLVSLLVMNQVSIWCIWTLLNPRYAPGWQIFHFPS